MMQETGKNEAALNIYLSADTSKIKYFHSDFIFIFIQFIHTTERSFI
jgi:hypothetical protein